MGQLVKSHSLRELYEAKGAVEFSRLIVDGLTAAEAKERLDADKFSLLEMAEATRYPWNASLRGMEGVDITTFPTITEKVIQAFMIPGWNRVQPTSSQCVGMEFDCTDNPIRVPGLTEPEGLKQRPPGGQYLETTLGEIYVQVDWPNPFGRIISLNDMDIRQDRTGQLKIRAAGIGQAAAETEEKEFWYSFADGGTAIDLHRCYAYYPAGTRTAIYTTGSSADTTGQTPRYTEFGSNALADITDVQNAESYLGKQTNTRGELLNIPARRQLICPRDLNYKARLVQRSQQVEKGTAKSGTTPATLLGGIGDDDADFDVVVAPLLGGLSASIWYWGCPKLQWVRAVFYPLEVLTETYGAGDSPYMTRDIVWQGRARWLKKSFALDYRYVIKNN